MKWIGVGEARVRTRRCFAVGDKDVRNDSEPSTLISLRGDPKIHSLSLLLSCFLHHEIFILMKDKTSYFRSSSLPVYVACTE